ncbi:Cinnamate-4-hydroxylase [Hibiscus syriacus]|uniref:Cinnamate-4-hydroxylase n=1 Tax=Hibiscus syriacus TaxID=106335 RepID=A0A6A2YJT4_HIBSY|nr:Cinnamate-4-hydroxylase [Hibiscus syriacus]
MLQWMGGSRRKSQLQKQYFEQRKQKEKGAVAEGHIVETTIAGRHQKECQSLDILNLLDLSTVSAEGKGYPSRSHGKFGASTLKYQMPKDPAIIISSLVPPYSVKIKEKGAGAGAGTCAPPSSYQGELQYPKVSFGDHDNYDLNVANNSLDLKNVANNSLDLKNAATENQLSVFDMLISDESEVSSERRLVHEAHVAFSVEGLGKIRTETPLHSPKKKGSLSRNSKCSFGDTDISYNIREDIWDDPSTKCLSPQVGHDFTSVGVSGRYNPFKRNYDIRDLPAQPDWPLFETEDATDSLSLLSEESCSSTAEKGETINSTFGRTRMKQSRRISSTFVLAKSKFSKPASCCLQGEIGPSQTWFLKEGCNSVDIDLGFSYSGCTPEANIPSLGSQLWAEDPIGAFHVPEFNLDDKSCFDRPKQ